MPRRRFRPADVAQQVVGGLLLAGPFVVTEEVWVLAEAMGPLHTTAAILTVIVVGYSTLYKADRQRQADAEAEVGGVPLRFLSLMIVAFGSVTLLTVVLAAPSTFDATLPTAVTAISVGSIFSVVGAAAADSLL